MRLFTFSQILTAVLAVSGLIIGSAVAFHNAEAKSGGGGGGGGGGKGDARIGRTFQEMVERGVVQSGLTPEFPDGLDCPDIASEFASPFRYDGSKRPANRNAGLHGGMDISLDIGTPLLAIADGTVIAKGTGGRALGEFVWMYHPPESTGLDWHIFVKYQHLSKESPFEIGSAVSAGQTVALSGDSGTADKHFAFGYPHLHASVFASTGAAYDKKGTRVRPRHSTKSIDLVALYLDRDRFAKLIADPTYLDGTDVPVKALAIGATPEPGAKVWPVNCKPK